MAPDSRKVHQPGACKFFRLVLLASELQAEKVLHFTPHRAPISWDEMGPHVKCGGTRVGVYNCPGLVAVDSFPACVADLTCHMLTPLASGDNACRAMLWIETQRVEIQKLYSKEGTPFAENFDGDALLFPFAKSQEIVLRFEGAYSLLSIRWNGETQKWSQSYHELSYLNRFLGKRPELHLVAREVG